MRFYVFISLLLVAFVLDLALLGLSLAPPATRLFEPPPVRAASLADQQPASPTPTSTSTPSPATPTSTSTPSPSPTASPSPSPTSTALPTATATPAPRLLAARSAAFTPGDRAVRANIRLALDHYYGALTHVVLAPGEVFSFNATLGLVPQHLPWKNVKLKPTAAPTPAPDAPPAPEPTAQVVQGGGLCDLASRFVMAARPLLPARAFQFVNHVRSNGIHLSGVPVRDSVSIWAIGGGRGEQDLKITNLSGGWLEFDVAREGEKITVAARLWDQAPPGW